MECVQESGDIVFVPEGWGHAVLNLAESIGFASEFQWGGSEFAIDPPVAEDDGVADIAEVGESEEDMVFSMGKI
jgi:uncharacterized protein YjlB